MKKPSAFVMGQVHDFIANQATMGEKFKAENNSYYGFVATKGNWGPFSSPFLTPAHLAKALGVSVKTLERLRMSGGGPKFIKVSKQVRYPIVELDNWVRENLMQQDSPESLGVDGDSAGL